ncbi:MAG: serine/threonine protein kinase [Lentisphaerae bacterium]|nr:serine/threonine protein kinase [Lentisphaerota bacterium]
MNDLEQLLDLYQRECREGRFVPPEVFAHRYPEFESELLELLPAIQAMEMLGQTVALPPPPNISYPEHLGEFTLLQRLGSGGMGTVFKAVQQSLNRVVAIKILSPFLADKEEQRKKFENEARIIAQLHHTNIVQVFGAGYDQGFCFYVMELIEGNGLHKIKLEDYFPGLSLHTAIAKVGLQAAEALAYAHKNNVIHHDIKPGNLLLDQQGVLHVSDFGLATIWSDENLASTATRTQDGTLRYMAPERLISGEDLFSSDQYSLGLTLYELFSGRPAIQASSPGQLIKRICEEPVAPLSGKLSDLAIIINKSISYSPAERYADISEMAADLQRYLNHLPIKARGTPLPRRFCLWAQRNPAVATLSSLAVLLTILLFMAVIYGYLQVSSQMHIEAELRKEAEEDARFAEQTLEQIFDRSMPKQNFETVLPSTATAVKFLHSLLPYYEKISRQRNAPPEKLAMARRVIGAVALQSGNLSLAEDMLRAALQHLPQPSEEAAFSQGQLALAVARQQRYAEAVQLWLEVAEQYGDSPNFDSRLEAARAYRSAALAGERRNRSNLLVVTPQERKHNLRQSARILRGLLQERENDPDCRFLQALLIDDLPELKREFFASPAEDSFTILARLISENPANNQYRAALVRLAVKLDISNPDTLAYNSGKIYAALPHADALMSLNPYDVNVLNSALSLRQKHIFSLQKRKQFRAADRETDRFIGMMKMLAAQPDISESLQECLLRNLLRQINGHRRQEQPEVFQRLLEETRALLNNYHGPKAKEFQQQLDAYNQ